MARKSIEHDLLSILKSKSDDELYYTVLSMLNGTYKYENSYLNNVSYEVLLAYLEKIIVAGSKNNKFNSVEDIWTILNFCQNFVNLPDKELKANFLLNVKYFFKINNVKIKNSLPSRIAVKRASSLLLSTCIFLNLCKNYKFNMIEVNDKSVGQTLHNDEIIAYDNGFLQEVDQTESTIEATEPSVETTEPTIKEPTNEEKIQFILEIYDLTSDEFDVLCAIVLTEAKDDSYDDAYGTINTIYNRTISKKWSNYVSNYFGEDMGFNIYYQAIMSGQFIVYEDGSYKENLGIYSGVGYQAIIDFLYNPVNNIPNIKHNFLSFKSASSTVKESVQFVEGGNRYHNELTEEDRIEIENKLSR